MAASQYFERTLFYDRNPDLDDYYETFACKIFETDISKAQIEVRIQSHSGDDEARKAEKEATIDKPFVIVEPHNTGVLRCGSRVNSHFQSGQVSSIDASQLENHKVDVDAELECNEDTNEDEYNGSVFSCASSTALPAAMDQRQGASSPPLYPGLPKLKIEHIAPADVERFVMKTKNDFRVFYLRQRNSFSQLQITREAFELLLKTCRVFPAFNEYVIGFGKKRNETEVGPPPFRQRSICSTKDGRWRGFECSYILRYIENTHRSGKKPWSLRQFAVYHRFKPAATSRCSTWILIGASKRTELRLDRYTRSVDDVFEANPFELHIIFLDTAIANWRPHLAYLTQIVLEQSGRSSGFTIGSEDVADDLDTIEVEDHQQLKQIEDDVADLLLCLDSTMDTLKAFTAMYQAFIQERDATLDHGPRADIIALAFETKAREISYTRKKAENLLSRIQNTRTLVSSLLERRSGHNIDQQIRALQKLEKQGQDENSIMRDLAEKSTRDSSSMRILTIITMVYLPCTIVSNFYSTQFVNQVESDTGHSTLEYTQNAWLFFAISAPLTIFTIFVWFLWVNSERVFRIFLRSNHNEQDRRLPRPTNMFRTKQPLNRLPR